jgi:hypothetical protein
MSSVSISPEEAVRLLLCRAYSALRRRYTQRGTLTRTQIIGILYLADLRSVEAFDQPFTKIVWYRSVLGPDSEEIDRAIDELVAGGEVDEIAGRSEGLPIPTG